MGNSNSTSASTSSNCNFSSPNWFGSICFQNIQQFQLDIVGFLAILGEGSVLANAQVASLSRVTYLPRLLPAPQALMRPSRPSVLPHANGMATAVKSGNHRTYVNHVGHVLVDAESLPAYSVRCVEIVRKPHSDDVKARRWGPLWWVVFLGTIEAWLLLGIAIAQKDGWAVLSALSLSFLSALVGVGNKGKLNLPKRKFSGIITPPGDVVIRYPKGSFLVVQCTEDVARELYFAPENIDYLVSHSWKYRLISLVGTFLLMIGVVSLGNASTHLQIGFAGAYMILNAAYWVVAALPSKVHWDMSCFEVRDQRFEHGAKEAAYSQQEGHRKHFVDHNETFTQALWKVIVATKDIDWVKRSDAAPQTEAWDVWLHEAQAQAEAAKAAKEDIGGKEVKVWKIPDWDPQKELARALAVYSDSSTV